MANGYNVSGLTAYVEENKDVLLKDMILGRAGGETIPMFRKALGIKTSERLHPLTVSPELQPVSGCGFSASGSTVISERTISTAQAKVNDEWCEEDLLGKFAEYQVSIEAGAEKMPFEAEIMNEVVKGVNKKIERQVWLGATSGTDLINGFITIALGADSASTITGATASGAGAYTAIKEALAAMPEELLNEDGRIFVSPAIFREYLQDLVAANLYHYNPNDGDFEEFMIPGSVVRVKKVSALAGSNYIYASSIKNMVYGADLLDAKEVLKVWFSDDNDVTRMKIRFNFGVQTLYPDYVVVWTKTPAA